MRSRIAAAAAASSTLVFTPSACIGGQVIGFDASALVKLGKDARAETVLRRLMAEGVSTRWAWCRR